VLSLPAVLPWWWDDGITLHWVGHSQGVTLFPFSYDCIRIVAGRGLLPDPARGMSFHTHPLPLYMTSMDSQLQSDFDRTGLVIQRGDPMRVSWVDLTMGVQS
jgi:hypothetical protein